MIFVHSRILKNIASLKLLRGKELKVGRRRRLYFCSTDDPLRYTQITTKNVVIKAPAIPDKTHSAVSIVGKTSKSQGHRV